MARRRYTDNAPGTTLQAQVTSSATSLQVASATGLPTVPFSATLERGTVSAEVVLVTNIAGTTLTVTRNWNGLGSFSHIAGAVLEHTVVAQDMDEANAHVNASSGVHGATGTVVGTTDTQTLSGKTLASAQLTGTTALTGSLNGATASATLQNATISSLAIPNGGAFATQGSATATFAAGATFNGDALFNGLTNVAKALYHVTFANAAARDAALTTPAQGYEVFLVDKQCLSVYTSAGWKNINDDTGWTNLPSTAGAGAANYRVRNGMVEMRFNLTGLTILSSATATAVVAAGALPAAITPVGDSAYGIARFTGNLTGACFAQSDGSVFVMNNTGSTQSVFRGSLFYLIG